MTSMREQTRRKELYQSLAHRAGLADPRIIARGMRILVEHERADVPTPHVSADLRNRALSVRSGLPARLSTDEVKVLAVIGS